jgi:hypothetical protein
MVDYRLLGTHGSIPVAGVGTCRLVDQHMGMGDHGKLGPWVRGQASWGDLGHFSLPRREEGLQYPVGHCRRDRSRSSTTQWVGERRPGVGAHTWPLGLCHRKDE